MLLLTAAAQAHSDPSFHVHPPPIGFVLVWFWILAAFFFLRKARA